MEYGTGMVQGQIFFFIDNGRARIVVSGDEMLELLVRISEAYSKFKGGGDNGR